MFDVDPLRPHGGYDVAGRELLDFLRSDADLELDTVRRAATEYSKWIRHALATRAASFSTQAADVVEALLNDRELMVVAAAAQYSPLSIERFEQLLSRPEPAIRRSLASRTELPDDILRRLAADSDSVVREFIASRNDLDPDLREALANDPRWNVRLAANPPQVPPPPTQEELEADLAELLAQLTPDADERIRAAVARHPVDLPGDVLERLSRDVDAVRIWIAARPQSLEREMLDRFARDPYYEVRLVTAVRKNLPADLRALLLTDSNFYVSDAAAAAAKREHE